jgi:hypothetical protein
MGFGGRFEVVEDILNKIRFLLLANLASFHVQVISSYKEIAKGKI